MRFLFISLSLFLTLQTQAFEFPKLWSGDLISKIGLPSSRLNDDASLFAWDYKLKVNQYLSKAHEQLSIDWNITILESLEGQSIEELIQEKSSSKNPNQAILLLSLSDRKFKLYFSEDLTLRLGQEKIDELVSLIIPALSKSNHQQALFLLFESSSFTLDPLFKISPPLPDLRKHRSLKGFTYFLAAFFFVFLLGHKVFTNARTKTVFSNKTNANEVKNIPAFKLFHHSFFLKSGLSFPSTVLNEFQQRLHDLKDHSDVSFTQFQANSSDLYPAAHFRSALALSILALTLLYFFPLEWRDPIYILAVFVQVLIIGYLLAFLPRIKRFFTSKREMKEETLQLLIETISKEHSLLNLPSFTIGYSKLENKIDFIFSSSLIEQLDKKRVTTKEIGQLLKSKMPLLRSGDYSNYFDSIITFLEKHTSSSEQIKESIENDNNPENKQIENSEPLNKGVELAIAEEPQEIESNGDKI